MLHHYWRGRNALQSCLGLVGTVLWWEFKCIWARWFECLVVGGSGTM